MTIINKLIFISSIMLLIVYFGLSHITANSLASEHLTSTKAEPKAMPVEVVIAEQRAIRLWKEFSGRLTAVEYVEIRPQATGIITEIRFKDGELVKKGDILYVIEPNHLKAIVAQESADLVMAKNKYILADKEYNRAKDLLQKNMISQQIYDERANLKLVADSSIKKAKAELSEAEINLEYAYIKAPINGRVSRTELTVGNLASSGDNSPLLTSIVSTEHIYADFEVDEQTYLNYVQHASSADKSAPKNPVELYINNGNLKYQGAIYAFDNKIDPASGTIRARAIFDNTDGKLLPGMFAHLKLGSAAEKNAILISELAIGTDQNRKFVYRIDDDNKTSYCEVQLGDSLNGYRIIASGLSPGDKVVVSGLMRIRPNMLVAPQTSAVDGSDNL